MIPPYTIKGVLTDIKNDQYTFQGEGRTWTVPKDEIWCVDLTKLQVGKPCEVEVDGWWADRQGWWD